MPTKLGQARRSAGAVAHTLATHKGTATGINTERLEVIVDQAVSGPGLRVRLTPEQIEKLHLAVLEQRHGRRA